MSNVRFTRDDIRGRYVELIGKLVTVKNYEVPTDFVATIAPEAAALRQQFDALPKSEQTSIINDIEAFAHEIAKSGEVPEGYWTWIQELVREGFLTPRRQVELAVATPVPSAPVPLFDDRSAPSVLKPPALAETVLALLYPANALEGVLGDMEEAYRALASRRGRARANVWYCLSVLKSSMPFLIALASRMLSLVSMSGGAGG